MATIAEIWAQALVHHKQGNMPAAEESYRQILMREPTHAEALHNLGLLAHQGGRHELAVKFIRQALAFKPAEASFHCNLGVVYHGFGKWDEACACYRDALRLQPACAEAYFSLGNALYKLARLEDALVCFRHAVRLRPDYPDAFNNMGNAYKGLDRLDDAIACFKEAVHLRPDFPEAYNNLGTTYNTQHRAEEAFAAFQEAIRLKPDFATAHHSLGSHFSQLGRFEDAAASFGRTLDLDPQDSAARYLLAVVSGANKPSTAPRQYVARLFDRYAGSFDRHLLMDLQYQGPKLLREAIADLPGTRSLDILDLGCGTGLSGLAFQDLARTLTGVDLSPMMLAQAKARGIYQNLFEGDVLEVLRAAVAAYDLLLAGDLFIYLGDMAEALLAAHQALRPGGRFVFDVEAHDEPGFTLRTSARFAHSLEYIRAQAHAAGLIELSWRKGVLRAHHAKHIESYVIVLQKP